MAEPEREDDWSQGLISLNPVRLGWAAVEAVPEGHAEHQGERFEAGL